MGAFDGGVKDMKNARCRAGFGEQASLYAIGVLGPDEAGAFAEHLAAGCPACEAELQSFRRIASALGLATQEAEPPADSENVLSKLKREYGGQSTTPDPFFTLRAGEGDWREFCPGITVKQLFFDDSTGMVTTLFRLAPGARAPIHAHSGTEQCLVLEGDFHVNGETYGPGDFSCAMPGSVHDDARSDGGALLLIVAPRAQSSGSSRRA